MTASIPLRIYPLPHSPGNRREQQERTDYSIRAFAARKALRRQDFPAAVFREGFTISSVLSIVEIAENQVLNWKLAYPENVQKSSVSGLRKGGRQAEAKARKMYAVLSEFGENLAV